jgi:hypothetical protein
MLDEDGISRVVSALAGAVLGDPRRSDRVRDVAESLARNPDASIPAAMVTEARLEAAYRLMNNRSVTFEALVAAQALATSERAKLWKQVLVLHDTTKMSPKFGTTESVGHLSTGNPGFFFHASLVVSGEDAKRPLGIAHGQTISRKVFSKRGRKASGGKTAEWNNRESERWFRGIESSEEALDGTPAIHVLDREGDSYELLAMLLERHLRFVIRCSYDRVARESEGDEWSKLRRLAGALDGVLSREVPISARQPKTAPRAKRKHPPRETRTATLSFAATKVTIPAPRYVKTRFKTLDLNVVRVWEENPPADQQAIEWLLYTTEPVSTPEEVARVVDIYRARWLVEEFFKALKTGCAYESREFESYDALTTLLAISLPIACELLWLRSRSREAPNSPASEVLTPTQLQVLRAKSPRALSQNPTAAEALLAVARLGGHLKSNGPPGWQVLYRGMKSLLMFEQGWLLAMEQMARTKA